jgi:hypothetical protein
MASDPERSSVVDKIVLHSMSKRVTLIYKDGSTDVFFGRNFYAAQAIAEKSSQEEDQDLQLEDDRGGVTIVVVRKNVRVKIVDD